ncbi:hypothetical protein [Pseudomonas viridiflava]|uniref:hypothetical protein n=1 Tax=Pseudomonas viridiflava TaxID=33069 RepID=UPI0013C2E2F7|nr:hypothetical protein [Pseudomonas viridiflava]
MINTVSSASSAHINSARQTSDIASASLQKKEPITRDASSANATLSTLSRQLADSAIRAEHRDKTMDRRQLGAEASRILNKMAESDWRLDRADYKIELPETDDPELLKRARQAAEFVARYAHNHVGAKNPFDGLSRAQLNLIVYDDEGPYTMDERSAACSAVCEIEGKWNDALWGPERLESAANNGRTPMFYTEVLAHYRTLEPIEEAQYPDIYESRLERQIKEASDPNSTDKKSDFELLSLFEFLARYGFPGDKKKPGILDEAFNGEASMAGNTKPAPTLKTSSLSPGASPTPAAAGRS